MKKQLITLGLAVLSVPAFASKARLESLGQDANGSQYIDDHRSVFLNVASLNQHKDWVTLEVGRLANDVVNYPGDQDSSSTPRAEGGVFKSAGNMVWGLYFGEESNAVNGVRAGAGFATSDYMGQNSTTFFLAGDAGVQWGASLLMQSYTSAGEKTAEFMATRIGITTGDLEVFANLGLASKADNGTQTVEGKSGFELGATYSAGNMTYMLQHRSSGYETDLGAVDTFEYSQNKLGVAQTYKLNDKAMMWVSAFYKMTSTTINPATGAWTEDKFESTELPVTVSVEASATDWLTLRGFVSQNVFVGESKDANGDKTTKDGLAQGVGASLVYGDLRVDGSLILGSGNDNGVMNIDEPMNRVSVTYNF